MQHCGSSSNNSDVGLLADIPGGPSSDMVVKDFHDALARSPDTAVAVAAIKVSSASLCSARCSFALLQRPLPSWCSYHLSESGLSMVSSHAAASDGFSAPAVCMV